MKPEVFAEEVAPGVAARLWEDYLRIALWALLALTLAWQLGIEAISYHPTPFYALLRPVSDSAAVFLACVWSMGTAYLVLRMLTPLGQSQPGAFAWFVWAAGAIMLLVACFAIEPGARGAALRAATPLLLLLVIGLFTAALGLLLSLLPALDWQGEGPSDRATRWLLAGTVAFSFCFSGAVAMVRGPDGVTQTFNRQDREYIGDIGRGLTIHGLFRDYNSMHPHLSLHAKAHPPGPVALLWFLSFFVGRESLGLSLAVMLLGALSGVPLYAWVREMTSRRTALIAAWLHALVPSVVLFSATSMDAAFLPFTLGTLFLFWRALHRPSLGYAVAAGLAYGAISLLHFSLLIVGAFFGFAGLWRLTQRGRRAAVVRTALAMLVAFLALHLLVRAWSGFDYIECMRLAKANIDSDRAEEALLSPRYALWAWRILNPLAWLFFAGIPVSLLFVRRLASPSRETRALGWSLGLTATVLALLYMGAGEGERSALYVFAFLVAPAADYLRRLGDAARSLTPLAVTLGFLAAQCLIMEAFLYTYW